MSDQSNNQSAMMFQLSMLFHENIENFLKNLMKINEVNTYKELYELNLVVCDYPEIRALLKKEINAVNACSLLQSQTISVKRKPKTL